MKVFKYIEALEAEIVELKVKKERIGFVPTMGALHNGHVALIERSKRENDVTVVSIFVNPTQFNNSNDFKKYPRDVTTDLILLNEVNADIVYIPVEDEIYPKNQPRLLDIDLGLLDKVMEGKFRPGHFKGVATVVERLFNIVKPDNAYFGLKDFQQVAVIKKLVSELQLPVNIVACPTIRESTGLAMSSRNALLSPAQRKKALIISETLQKAKETHREYPVEKVKEWICQQISNFDKEVKLEYFEIVNEDSLQTTTSWQESGLKVGCIAAFVGDVRLIDNIYF